MWLSGQVRKMMVGRLAWCGETLGRKKMSSPKLKPNNPKLAKIYPTAQNSASVRRIQKSPCLPNSLNTMKNCTKLAKYHMRRNKTGVDVSAEHPRLGLEARKDKRKTVSTMSSSSIYNASKSVIRLRSF